MSKIVKGKAYLLQNIPPDLYARVKARAEGMQPPLSIRWLLIKLLEKWDAQQPPIGEKPEKKPRTADAIRLAEKRKAKKAAEGEKSEGVSSPPADDDGLPDADNVFPDLSGSF